MDNVNVCAICARPAEGPEFCPRLTMPWDGGWSMGAVYPVDPYKHPPLPLTDRPTWWLRFEHENDPTRTIKSESARAYARADCAKHAVDWRNKALVVEACNDVLVGELLALRANLEMFEAEVTGTGSAAEAIFRMSSEVLAARAKLAKVAELAVQWENSQNFHAVDFRTVRAVATAEAFGKRLREILEDK